MASLTLLSLVLIGATSGACVAPLGAHNTLMLISACEGVLNLVVGRLAPVRASWRADSPLLVLMMLARLCETLERECLTK